MASQREMFVGLMGDGKTYIGIDPGENGAIAMINEYGYSLSIKINGATDRDLWNVISKFENHGDGSPPVNTFACIELQTPRPTNIPDGKGGWRQTILASTCILYGRFQQAVAFLIAAGIPFEIVPPKRWQQGLNIPAKPKGMKDPQWKNVLKSKAQQLFPEEKVTLANADALLLAEYCRRKQEGKL